jgi:hypothetical protein
MVFIIAQTAAKPATFHSPTLVPTEPKSVCLQIDPDARLAAGAGGVAKFFAETAGLDGDAPQQLQAAVTAACLEACEQHTSDHPLSVTFTRHRDRIEVALSREGESGPAVGLNTIAAGASALNGVDRIQYETQGNRAITRLTKYTSQAAPSR